ncbi:MAG: TlpA family protein disulfide reductase [Gammaproteobacteria bacterium]
MTAPNDPTDPTSPPRRRWRWLGELAVVLAAVLAIHLYQTWDTATGVAPPLEGVDLSGRPLTLTELRGQPVLVHFWATWCPICRLEEDSIQAISQDWTVFSVALEDTPVEALRAYRREAGLSFPTLRDVDGQLAARYGVRGVPTSIVVDANGNIRFTSVGYTTGLGLRLRLWLATTFPRGSSRTPQPSPA